MKKYLVALALASAFLVSGNVPSRASEGTIIHMKTTPTPTPTPQDVPVGGRSANTATSQEIPSFWDFLSYFGL